MGVGQLRGLKAAAKNAFLPGTLNAFPTRQAGQITSSQPNSKSPRLNIAVLLQQFGRLSSRLIHKPLRIRMGACRMVAWQAPLSWEVLYHAQVHRSTVPRGSPHMRGSRRVIVCPRWSVLVGLDEFTSGSQAFRPVSWGAGGVLEARNE